MDELRSVYELIVDMWALFRRYYEKLDSDEAWERFITEGQGICSRQKDKKLELLGRDLFRAIEKYLESDSKENAKQDRRKSGK